jgi:hypothetical protein
MRVTVSFVGICATGDFLECIADRKNPNAPVEEGQATNIVPCIAMDVLRSGRRGRWNAHA